MSGPNYWGYRTNWRNSKAHEFFYDELREGHLRQGWGWDPQQDLRHPTLDKGEKRNLPIFNNVKKGDYLLIPHMPSYYLVTIVRATEDFNMGYTFKLENGQKDYGHCFPVEFCCVFNRGNKKIVHADIRSSLRNPMRFWCMSPYKEYIQNILRSDKDLLLNSSQHEVKALDDLKDAIRLSFDEVLLQNNIKKLFEHSFQSSEWEYAIRCALDLLFPNYSVVRVGGKAEKEHGCDLAVFIPGIELDRGYVIGIQIKDYKNSIDPQIINQICKADYYDWKRDGTNYKLIDKYLIIIDAESKNNEALNRASCEKLIHVLYRDDVIELLARAAKTQLTKL